MRHLACKRRPKWVKKLLSADTRELKEVRQLCGVGLTISRMDGNLKRSEIGFVQMGNYL